MAPTFRPAALAAGLFIAALATPTMALAVENGTDPTVNAPVYPGTTTPVDGWKLIGNIVRPAQFPDRDGASGVLIAPRLVLASAHAAGEQGGTFTTPNGDRATIVANALRPGQARVGQNDGTPDGKADVSLSLLDRALPTPAGGFPLLLTTRLTPELVPSLPGFVLWGGRGGTTLGKSLVAWGRPGGTPIGNEPRPAIVEGDSGSTGLLYTSPTARPLMPGVNVFTSKTQLGQVDLDFGGVPNNVTLADPLVQGTTAATRYATVGDWLVGAINGLAAANPGLQAPAYATLAQAGIDVNALRPVAPSALRNTASGASTTLTWDAPTETRIPRTGYRITDSADPTRPKTTTATSVTFDALSPNVEHRFTLRSYNANGESPDQRTFIGEDRATIVYARPVTGLTVTTEEADGSTTGAFGGGTPGPDFCATATWTAPQTDPGTVIEMYEATLNGQPVSGEYGATRIKQCGLSPSQLQTFVVRPVVGPAVGAPASASASTPAQSTPPSPPPAPTNLKVTEQKTVLMGRCLTVTWTPPSAAGVTLLSQTVKFLSSTGATVATKSGLSATTTSFKQCYGSAATRYTVVVSADLRLASGAAATTSATTEFTTAR